MRFLTPVCPEKRRKQSCNRALTARTEVSIISKKYKKRGGVLARIRFQNSTVLLVLLGFLFFFVLSLGATDVIKTTVMLIAVVSLLVFAVRFKTLRERISLPFIILTLCVLMDGISTFYAVSGKFALREFLKVFLAFLFAVILLAASPEKEEIKGKRIAAILAVCAAFGSLVSIDLISTRWISGAILGILGVFTDAYKSLVGVETGIRMTSMFTNPNTYAGFAGIGVLLSLGLVCNSGEDRKRVVWLVLLYVNALGFLLAFSMGASAFIALAFLVLCCRRAIRCILARPRVPGGYIALCAVVGMGCVAAFFDKAIFFMDSAPTFFFWLALGMLMARSETGERTETP